MRFPLVEELAADGFPSGLTCGVLGFSTPAFYKAQASPVCARDLVGAQVVNAIVDIHGDDPEICPVRLVVGRALLGRSNGRGTAAVGARRRVVVWIVASPPIIRCGSG